MANKRLRKELQQTARGLYELGAIDGKTMRDFESLRLKSPKAQVQPKKTAKPSTGA